MFALAAHREFCDQRKVAVIVGEGGDDTWPSVTLSPNDNMNVPWVVGEDLCLFKFAYYLRLESRQTSLSVAELARRWTTEHAVSVSRLSLMINPAPILSMDEIQMVLQSISQMPSITELTAHLPMTSDAAVGIPVWQSLVHDILAGMPSITALNLSWTSLTTSGPSMPPFGPGFLRFDHRRPLQKLTLRVYGTSPSTMRSLLPVLRDCCDLVLYAEDDQSSRLLKSLLTELFMLGANVERLTLGTRSEAEAFGAVAGALRCRACRVEDLAILHTEIAATPGWESLVAALAVSTSVKRLYLTAHGMTDEALRLLLAALTVDGLESLQVQANLSNYNAMALVEALSSSRTLRRLDLSGNALLDDQVADYLVRTWEPQWATRGKPLLQELSLAGTAVTNTGAAVLAALPSLVRLDVQRTLVDCIASPPPVTLLSNLSPAGWDAVAPLLLGKTAVLVGPWTHGITDTNQLVQLLVDQPSLTHLLFIGTDDGKTRADQRAAVLLYQTLNRYQLRNLATVGGNVDECVAALSALGTGDEPLAVVYHILSQWRLEGVCPR